MESNRCPFCGGSNIRCMTTDGVYGCGPGRTAFCCACNAMGKQRILDADAIIEFCHPTHLLKTLHTVDPVTEIKIKRETGEQAYSWVMGFVGSGGMTNDDYAAKDDLTAALEGDK